MDWQGIWNDIVSFFSNNAWNIFWFAMTLILGIIVIKILMNIIRRIFKKTKMEDITQQFLCAVVKFCLYLVWILILFSEIGIQVSGILTALSACILAIGMALQSNIANLANGIVIIATHMFKKGDYLVVNGVEGLVTEVHFLFTTLTTYDNKKVTIPNSSIVGSSLVNLGANPKRRVDFTFSVAHESDLELVKKTVTDVMKSNGKVYLDPAPFCKLKAINTNCLDFFSNCWCDTEDYWEVYYYVMEHVYNEFRRNNISVPYKQVEVRERKDVVNAPVVGKGLPERVEKVRVFDDDLDLETASLEDIIKKGRRGKAEREAEKKARKERKRLKKKNAKKEDL